MPFYALTTPFNSQVIQVSCIATGMMSMPVGVDYGESRFHNLALLLTSYSYISLIKLACKGAVFGPSFLVATCINVTAKGRPYISDSYLGAAIGSQSFFESYASSEVVSWVAELGLLASFAITQIHQHFHVA